MKEIIVASFYYYCKGFLHKLIEIKKLCKFVAERNIVYKNNNNK